MKLEDQVCSIDLAIKLHKLGVIKPSIFFYEWTGATELSMWKDNKPDFCEDNICAYTVAELGEMLPNPLILEGKRLFFGSEHVGCEWECGTEGMLDHTFVARTEADARAKMLIYLLENKLINL